MMYVSVKPTIVLQQLPQFVSVHPKIWWYSLIFVIHKLLSCKAITHAVPYPACMLVWWHLARKHYYEPPSLWHCTDTIM